MIEEHWTLDVRPSEVKPMQDSVLLGDSVLEGALIKSHRRKIRKGWMHTVLDLEPDRP